MRIVHYDTLFVAARLYFKGDTTKIIINYREKWLPVETPEEDGWTLVLVQPSENVKERRDGNFYGIAMYQKEKEE